MNETDSDEDEEWFKPVEVTASDSVKAVSKQNTGNHSRVILHIDIDCFYAQVEMLRNPQFRTKPLGIQQKYIIVTCNYVARERGLTKLMTVKDAREKCPGIVLVNGEDLTNYRSMSYKISNYLQKYCPLVERLGFDENFLDITDLVNERINNGKMKCPSEVNGHVYLSESSKHGTCTCGCWTRLVTGSHIAAEIRAGLQKELGITCCGGIAHNKLLSKLVAATHKPSQQTTLFPDDVKALMSGLTSVRSIQGIGHTTARRLKELGVVTVEDLQNVEVSVLEEEFGQMSADTMKKLCIGIDESPVVAFGLPQTLSDEDSFKKCSDLQDAKARIGQLVNSLLHRLLEDGRRPQTLRLTIRRMSETNRYNNRECRQCTIPSTLFKKFSADNLAYIQNQLEVLAYSLFTKMVDTRSPFHLTLINVAFAKLDQKSSNDISNFFSPRGTQQPYSKKTNNSTDGNCNVSLEQHEAKSELVKTAEKIHNTSWTTSQGKAKSPGKTSVSGIQKWLVKPTTDHVKEGKDVSAIQKLDTDSRFEDKQHVNESVTNKDAKRLSDESCFDLDRENFRKRSRIDITSGNQSGSVADLLPADIDLNVFLELPPHIQKEVLENTAAHRGSGVVSKETVSNISSEKGGLSRNFTRTSYQSTAACTLANTDSSQTTNACFGETECYAGGIKTEDENTFNDLHAEKFALDRKHASHMKPPRTDKKYIMVQTSGTFNLALNEQVTGQSKVDRQVSGQSKVDRQVDGQSKVDRQEAGQSKEDRQVDGHSTVERKVSVQSKQSFSETFRLPPDIDETVFSSLPPLVQQELIQQWKCEKDSKIKSTGKVGSPDKQFFKSPKPSTSSSITDFFPKKS